MPERYGIYPESVARELLNFYREMKAQGLLQPSVIRRLLQIQQPPKPSYWNVYNISGQKIFPYSCLQVLGTTSVANKTYLEVDFPLDANGDNGPYVFLGNQSLEAFRYGVVQKERKVRANIESLGSATSGTHFSPVVGSGYIEESSGGPFVLAGLDFIENNGTYPAWQVVDVFYEGSGGGGMDRISFEINESGVSDASASGQFGAYKSASVTILSASCGQYSLVGTTVTVYDIIGCYFDEASNAAMDGRKGHAEWSVIDNSGAASDCFWEVTGLCCPS